MNVDLATGSLVLASLVALLAGLVSFASPCVLPLVPGFLGYVTGLSDESLEQRSRGRLVLGALLFVAGFTVVFLIAAAALSAIGVAFREHQSLLLRIGGALVIVMGVLFLGAGKSYAAQLGWRPRAGLLGAPLLGAAFAVGWSPCWGPTLGAIQAMAAPISAETGSIGRGLILATIYSVGLGLPFVLMAALWERAGRASDWLRRHRGVIQTFGGVMLIIVGLLMVTGLWENVIVWLQINFIATFQVAI
ncbi:cytochrome c biogenesis CcdA family protein [Intrasporangium calvum]|uniref:Cytochrome c biogenesis CcdA family protein n=1 Tax=Intrasporangium calvum TaxID=53358 RepID=A0ABT5GEW8_9MICO|nr:cytochrome c biogenesis CcdA family protein [Intrasporangium calvum]MDC5696431.1 cytochrome c biogenesis CcdA family protein [Intrasporangium calvum]